MAAQAARRPGAPADCTPLPPSVSHMLTAPALHPPCLSISPAEAVAVQLASEYPEFDAGLIGELLAQEDGDDGELWLCV